MTAKHSADVGLVGRAVMGQNLALNMANHGFTVAVYNRTIQVMRDFMPQYPETPSGLIKLIDTGTPGQPTWAFR